MGVLHWQFEDKPWMGGVEDISKAVEDIPKAVEEPQPRNVVSIDNAHGCDRFPSSPGQSQTRDKLWTKFLILRLLNG